MSTNRNGKAKASRKSAVTQPKANEVLEWLEKMPEGFTEQHDDIPATLTLNLDPMAWTIYARGTKRHGCSIEEMLSAVLCDVDLEFEEQGYKTGCELFDEQRKERAEAPGSAK